jgi:uncharacterized protein involved in exopolysaccharide biosynthesis
MKLKRFELEAFDKMLVDKYNKLDIDYRELLGKYKTLQTNYEVKSKQIAELKQQIEMLKQDIRQSGVYKQMKSNNKALRNRVNALQKDIGILVYKLNIKNNES